MAKLSAAAAVKAAAPKYKLTAADKQLLQAFDGTVIKRLIALLKMLGPYVVQNLPALLELLAGLGIVINPQVMALIQLLIKILFPTS